MCTVHARVWRLERDNWSARVVKFRVNDRANAVAMAMTVTVCVCVCVCVCVPRMRLLRLLQVLAAWHRHHDSTCFIDGSHDS